MNAKLFIRRYWLLLAFLLLTLGFLLALAFDSASVRRVERIDIHLTTSTPAPSILAPSPWWTNITPPRP